MSVGHQIDLSPGDNFVRIGAGKGFQAYRDSEASRVVKVSHAAYDLLGARQFRDTLRGEFELIKKHLGNLVLDTEIEAIPAAEGLWVVVQGQPFIPGISVGDYVGSSQVDDSVVEEVVRAYHLSREMRRRTGHMPDLWGRPGGLPKPMASNNLLVGVHPGKRTYGPALVDVNFGSKQRNPLTRPLINVPQSAWLGHVAASLSK